LEARSIDINEIESYQLIKNNVDVYDIEVEDNHSFLLENGIIVHNSGKSFGGTLKIVLKKLKYPGIDVAYYLPTYGLIKDIAFPNISELLTLQNIPFTLNKSDKEFITPFGKIIMRSMDCPELIVGFEVGYSIIDEADVISVSKMNESFKNIVARNRKKLPNGDKNCLDFVSTPEGFGFLYNFFVKNPSPEKLIIKASSLSNPFLPKDYIDTLRLSYTEAQLSAYINGEFVNLTSASVYNFDRTSHDTDTVQLPNEMLFVGLDFNVTNMNAVINVKRNGKLYAVGEIAEAYNTQQIAEFLLENYPNHKIIINPDASGNQRSSSGASDFAILRQFGFDVVSPKKNPPVSERVNAVNLALQDGTFFVNTKRCPKLTESLENQAYKNGVPDKSSGYDHITEAQGYCIHKNLFGKVSQIL
jgi:phage terminase large subunit